MDMTQTLLVRDQTAGGDILRELELIFDREKVPLGDVIEARVRQEVETFNREDTATFQGLVTPSGAEQTPNGARLRKPRHIDADRQVRIALKAFENNSYFVLVGDKQVEFLDDVVSIDPSVNVSFIKLTPLVGG